MSEHNEQVALFKWVELSGIPELKLLHAVPNGGKRDIVTAIKLRNEGVKPGVPDMFLPVARNGWHGLFIEMKTEEGRLSPLQKEWIAELEKQGYFVAVCRGWEMAKETLKEYLG